ncbi:alpha/beta hydrolase-fold protein [Marinomonas ostreistagni]|uniref:SEL1-like repeat protein n=1 Tax=Marinomonas ostreistagni TaxID=359209 RepID=A0ABS0ZFP1_9GAMM|nr:alpha/beta hydrolase-fold protein [Marinomonas ostreistagni]MBJ7552476.1 SEL1-like repeat protein [Marinomonas ostreistagni]
MKKTLLALTISTVLAGCSALSSNGSNEMALYEQANKTGEESLALQYLTQASLKGNSQATARLGEAYMNGRYGLDDEAKGAELLQKAADEGERRAMTDLGIAYLYGQGVQQDYQQAYVWLNKAKNNGDMKAPRYIGLVYQNGWGKAIDYVEAASNFELAANRGDITSQYYLGKLYETGQGVQQDYVKAIALYNQSASRGDHVSLPAILALANVYENGIGVKRDTKQALSWYAKASRLGSTEAKEKIGYYQYPDHPKVMNVTALVDVLGDGQKVAGVAIEFTQDIDISSLDISDFQVNGREIQSVYVNDKAELGTGLSSGSFVIVTLKTDIDPESSQMGGGPSEQDSNNSEKNSDQAAHGNGPTLGQISDKSAEPTILDVSIIQSGEVSLVSGQVSLASDAKMKSNATLNPAIEGFQQLVFHDDELDKDLMYNLYVPKNYDTSKSYPLVLFMHDAGVVSNNPTEALTQGLGGVIWASERDQALHESFVLVPQYNAIMADDNSQTSVDMDVTVNLIKSLSEQYAIDEKRLYNTGQSMGGMTSIAMDIKYPDLFAASLLVACQWDPELVAPLANKPLWIVVSEGDTKANPGMDAITDVLANEGATVSKAKWDAQASKSVMAAQVSHMLKQGAQVNYTVFEGGSHRYTWQYAYSIDAIRDWLFAQHK